MNIPTEPSPATTQSLLAVCTFAAMVDGNITQAERENLRKLAEDLGGQSEEMVRDVLLGKFNLAHMETLFAQPNEKLLAYEMALAVCEADGEVNPRERSFLEDLSRQLGLEATEVEEVTKEVDAICLSDPSKAVAAIPTVGLNKDMIMRYAILNGALEILPGTLATMAILPLQMKLVHAIAKSHGVNLGTANIKDFLATLGVGVTSQIVEGFARKLLGNLGKSVGGKLAGKIANQAAGSAMSFASTYAIGHVADRYYAGGQKLVLSEIQSLMGQFSESARTLYSSKMPEIQSCASNLNPAAILDLVRGGNTKLP